MDADCHVPIVVPEYAGTTAGAAGTTEVSNYSEPDTYKYCCESTVVPEYARITAVADCSGT